MVLSQTTSAYLHWCGADPPSSLSTPAPSLAMAPQNEVIFLPCWRGFASGCGWCDACACVFVCICMHMHIHRYVGIYICALFCSECYMHFTGVLGTSARAGVYVTQLCFYTKVHICGHTCCRLCTYVYMYICVYMHVYAYGCVCASMVLLDTLRRCY